MNTIGFWIIQEGQLLKLCTNVCIMRWQENVLRKIIAYYYKIQAQIFEQWSETLESKKLNLYLHN